MEAREVVGGAESGFRPHHAGAPGPEWIVCWHATRDVAGEQVICPLGGRALIEACLDCHLLEAVEADWRLPGCEVPAAG